MWIFIEKCLEVTGGTGMSLVCGRNPSRRRMTERQEAGRSTEYGCMIHNTDTTTKYELEFFDLPK